MNAWRRLRGGFGENLEDRREASYGYIPRRYQLETETIESLKQDMAVVKRVLQEHSERLKKIAVF